MRGQRDGYVKRQFDHGFDYRLVDFDSDDANSFSGFARSFDVFGDGSVRIVFTPGHTAGHMSVVLQTEHGEVLVAGDAIFMRRTLDDDHLPHMHLRRPPLPALAARDQAVREGDPGRRRDRAGARLGSLAEAEAGLLGRGEVKFAGCRDVDRVGCPRVQAIRFSAWRRSSMYWKASACAPLR